MAAGRRPSTKHKWMDSSVVGQRYDPSRDWRRRSNIAFSPLLLPPLTAACYTQTDLFLLTLRLSGSLHSSRNFRALLFPLCSPRRQTLHALCLHASLAVYCASPSGFARFLSWFSFIFITRRKTLRLHGFGFLFQRFGSARHRYGSRGIFRAWFLMRFRCAHALSSTLISALVPRHNALLSNAIRSALCTPHRQQTLSAASGYVRGQQRRVTGKPPSRGKIALQQYQRNAASPASRSSIALCLTIPPLLLPAGSFSLRPRWISFSR